MRKCVMLMGLAVVAGAGTARGALLGLSAGAVNLTLAQVNIIYSSSGTAGTFTVTGVPTLKNPGATPITGGTFNMTVNLTHGSLVTDPVTVTSATLNVLGDGGTLYSFSGGGLLPQFGFATSGTIPTFEVLFPSNGGGSLGSGGPIGVIVSTGEALSNYPLIQMTASFHNGQVGTGTVFGGAAAAPEAGTVGMLALGAGLLLRRRRCAGVR